MNRSSSVLAAGLCAAMVYASGACLSQTTGMWESLPAMPTGGAAKVFAAVAVERDGSIYVLGGLPWYNTTEDGSVFSLDLSSLTWTQEVGFDGTGAVLGQGGGLDALGRIVIFGGRDTLEPTVTPGAFDWDPSEGPWHDLAARGPSAPQSNFADCTDSQGRIYSFGGGPGESASSGNQNSSYAERYDGASDAWTAIAPMPMAAGGVAAAPDGLGHILVFGGVDATGTARLTSVQRYDIASNSWSVGVNADAPVGLSDHEAVLGADGRVYVMGGTSGPIGSGTVEAAVHVYDPMTDAWSLAPDMSEPRRFFSAELASDDYLYVFGGANNSGGSAGAERLYQTTCPVVFGQPDDATIWGGTNAAFDASVAGPGVIDYQWELDGTPLTDGPSAGGGTIVGATTTSLRIEQVGAGDAGAYTLTASNACGQSVSAPAQLTVNEPPTIATHWAFTSLHPSIAEASYATAVDGGVQVGRAIFDTPEYNNIDHPWVWTSTAVSGRNLTPAGSQGGSVSDVAGDKLVGWWWEPLSCYVNGQLRTCYYQRAGRWDFAGNFYDTSYSGFEYTTMTATDGTSIVGSGATDDASGNYYARAVIWPQPEYWYAQSIHPTSARNSSVSAVEGNDQFGSISLPFGAVRAAKWSGSAATYVDMQPAWAVNSTISDASDGQQVGTSNQWTDAHALLWSGTPGSVTDLHPAGATKSSAIACDSGLQVGSVVWDGQTAYTPVLWAGNAQSVVEIVPTLPPEYSSFAVAGIDVDAGGTISLVGSAYNAVLGRNEAMLLTSMPEPTCAADTNGDGLLTPADFTAWIAAFNASAPACDQNGDMLCTPADFTAWIANYNAGC